jgi:Fe-S-cluster containining protein
MIQPVPERDQFTICTQECRGRCCRYITVPVATPTCHDDWDEMRWWLAHEGISVSKDEDGWSLNVPARCGNLREDNACAIYPHHMDTCKEYEADCCEFTGPIDQEFELRTESDLGDYLERRRLKRGARVLAAIRAAEAQRPRNRRRGLVQMQLLSP